ncbi:hypothetical protein Taro_002882 [Colocasia esculenta]|uniref:Uncharacterized protein n=1 Tax=Colocasia esculenta TaxID=4460 RepID=A0A843TKG2_COLES|nr:hypothetical protein [Colocasia esculenta]
MFSFSQCSALEGLSARQVVTVTWDPQPRASIRGSSLGGGRTQVSDLEQKGKTWGQRRRVVCRALLAGLSLRGGSTLVWCGTASPSHYLALRWFRSHIGRSGVGSQFGRTAVFVVVFFAVTR